MAAAAAPRGNCWVVSFWLDSKMQVSHARIVTLQWDLTQGCQWRMSEDAGEDVQATCQLNGVPHPAVACCLFGSGASAEHARMLLLQAARTPCSQRQQVSGLSFLRFSPSSKECMQCPLPSA